MCIIVDACCANALGNSSLPQSKLLLDWVKSGGKIISGGKLENELRGTALQGLLVAWSASGRLIAVDRETLRQQEGQINREVLKSNDLHVIALAKVSGAGVVVTRDKALMIDLKKSGQIDPAPKIYPFPDNASTKLNVQRNVLRKAGCK